MDPSILMIEHTLQTIYMNYYHLDEWRVELYEREVMVITTQTLDT